MVTNDFALAARKTLFRLGAAYALAWAATSMVAGPGSAAFVGLTGNLKHAGIFVALTFLGAAAGAAIAGRAMDKFGRKAPLLVAYLTHAVGFTIAGIGASTAQLLVFVVGTLTFAAAFGAINLTRLSAAEMFPPAQRGKGVSYIQISAIFGAVTGPVLLLLAKPLGEMLGRPPLEFVWFLAPPLLIIAALILRTADEPTAIAERVAAAAGPASAIPMVAAATSAQLAILGVVTLTASQAGMAAVMGVAGAAVSHAGHDISVLGWLMFAHFIGMFGLSRIVGHVADKIGRLTTMSIGLVLLSCGGLTVALFQSAAGFGVGLMLVGFGWSFGFIGSTVLLTDVTVPAHRARVIGRADLTAQLVSAAIATGGGWWFALHGVSGLGLLAVAVAAIPLSLVAWVGYSRNRVLE